MLGYATAIPSKIYRRAPVKKPAPIHLTLTYMDTPDSKRRLMEAYRYIFEHAYRDLMLARRNAPIDKSNKSLYAQPNEGTKR